MSKRRTKEELAEFDANVIVLRRSGLTFEEIGKRLNDSHVNAYRAFQRVIKNIPIQSAEELRILQNLRLEKIYLVAYSKIKDPKHGPQFAKQALDALKQIAELNGLNAPKVNKNEHTGKNGGPIQTTNPLTTQDFAELSQEERDALRAIAEKRIAMASTH